MYQVKAYETNRYAKEFSRAFRDRTELLKWAIGFLSAGNRKVIVSCCEYRYRFARKRHNQTIWTWTEAEEPRSILYPPPFVRKPYVSLAEFIKEQVR